MLYKIKKVGSYQIGRHYSLQRTLLYGFITNPFLFSCCSSNFFSPSSSQRPTLRQCQQAEMTPRNRPRNKRHRVRTDRIPSIPNRLKKIRKSPIRTRNVQPIPQPIHKQPPGLRPTRRRCPQTLIRFRVRMPVIQRDAENLGYGRVKVRLHFVQGGGDDGEVEEESWIDVVKEGVGRAPLIGEQCVCS